MGSIDESLTKDDVVVLTGEFTARYRAWLDEAALTFKKQSQPRVRAELDTLLRRLREEEAAKPDG